jgi:hypothetical protein
VRGSIMLSVLLGGACATSPQSPSSGAATSRELSPDLQASVQAAVQASIEAMGVQATSQAATGAVRATPLAIQPPRSPAPLPTPLPQGAAQRPIQPASAKPGQRFQGAGIALSLNSVSKTNGSGDSEADPGMIYVVADVTLENTGQDSLSYGPWDFKTRDADGFEYTSLWSVQRGLNSGDLPRGQNIRGFVVFEVPPNARGLTMIYQPAFGRNNQPLYIPLER